MVPSSPPLASLPTTPPDDPHRNPRILIVDDNRAIHDDFRKILQPGTEDDEALDAAEQSLFGETRSQRSKLPVYRLASAFQGSEGAALAAEAVGGGQPFAVAFVDMRMPPGWDGLETIEKLWEQQPDLQVVLCTAHSDYSLETIQERLDVSDRLLILKKPFDTLEVLQLAKTLTEKWRLAKISRATNGNLRHIVDKRTAELVQANQRMAEQAQLINLAQDSISVRDLAGRIISWNRGSEKIYGYRAEEAIGRDATSLIYGGAAAAYEEAFAATLERGEWTGERSHRHRSGAEIIVNSRWTLLRDKAGQPKLILVINSDVTEHKELQAQFLRVQRLESIGTLANGLAHDLNNILAPILAGVPLLRSEDLSRTAREKVLANVEASAERGAGIVRQMLTFGRGVQGDRVLLRPSQLLEEVGKIVRETFPKTIGLWVHAPATLWPVAGDHTQLHQVLLNLAVNARDAMLGGGEMVLTAENLRIDEHFVAMMPEIRPGPHVVIQMRDSGNGISKEMVERIFDPFFTTKGPGQGSGLGLSTAAGIVKSHGGAISVSSEPGNGTTFKVFLPASTDALPDLVRSTDAPLPHGQGELVLVVDDEQGVREIAQAVLEQHGYRVLVAADGPQAFALFSQRPDDIRLVVTDLMMPFMDGTVLIRVLRELRPTLPVVASTGSGDNRYKQQLEELGVPVCLAKPYHKEELLQALHSLLRADSASAST